MKAGKLSESVLKRSVLRQLHTVRPELETGPGVGQDYSSIRLPDGKSTVHAVSTMPLSAPVSVEATVYNALNNLVCSGAEPVGILVNLLLPTASTEQQLRDMMCGIDVLCAKENLAVLGGHTEVVRAVTEPVLTVTAVGSLDPSVCVNVSRVKPGMDILVTKWVGLLGTALLAENYEEELLTRYAQPFITQAKRFRDYMSVRSEAAVAVQSGVCAMHDISEGGIYGALWEMGQGSGVGLEIDLKQIPIRQETIEICEFFDVNPYKLLSTGSLLMAAEDGNAVVRAIRQAGGEAAVIGKATDSNDRVLLCEDERRFLETTQTDELWEFNKKKEIAK